jgi:3-dehydroquinate synthase
LRQKIKTEIAFVSDLPPIKSFGDETVFFYDKILLKVSPKFKTWIHQAPNSIALDAGEKIKDLSFIEKIVPKLQAHTESMAHSKITFVAIGGGSVGDAVGFLASIYKRGVKLVHVPSTWLAAIDSSHGGKTALNVKLAKNQLGTFYPAQKIIIVKSLLYKQNEKLQNEAWAEAIKIGLLTKGLFSKVDNAIQKQDLWSILPFCIQAKYRIVNLDPREQTGVRRVLNLGHTVGHVFEKQYKWSHGLSVAAGTLFAIQYSWRLGLLSEKNFFKWINSESFELLDKVVNENSRRAAKISKSQFLPILNQDKKSMGSGKIQFILLKEFGKPVQKSINATEIYNEYVRQLNNGSL